MHYLSNEGNQCWTAHVPVTTEITQQEDAIIKKHSGKPKTLRMKKAAFVSLVLAAVTGEEDVGGPICAARPDFLTTLRCQKVGQSVQCLFVWGFSITIL